MYQLASQANVTIPYNHRLPHTRRQELRHGERIVKRAQDMHSCPVRRTRWWLLYGVL